MLGSNFPATPWPSCGEIDIMEMIGGYNPDASAREQTVYGTIHYSNNASSYASNGNSMTLQSGDFQDKFHVFSLVWSANSIEWLVDDVPFQTLDISNDFQSEFRQPFFFIFNVAVGGNWPGSPSQSTVFPQAMIVEYVRVFQ
jgi:beta-glucanase (GH16 family)